MTSTVLPPASSITHLHLLACANTELRASDAATVRILDAGCGDGRLVAYLHECLTRLHPGWSVELYGFDVVDHGVQQAGFIDRAARYLNEQCPVVDWTRRIHALQANDPWPFDAQCFDLVLSNQVLEHVHDHPRFFAEAYRVLANGGASINLFPLKHYVHEGHLHLPWVHRIRSHDLRVGYIALLSWLGFGKYTQHRQETGVSIQEFSERHADYMAFWTNYLSEAEALDISRRAGFRSSLRYTSDFYAQKIRALCRISPVLTYRRAGRGLRDSLGAKALRYVSSVTLACHKENKY